MKNKAEISEIKNKILRKIFRKLICEKFEKIYKPLPRLIRGKNERNQITKIKMIGDTNTKLTEIKRPIRESYKKLHANELDNLDILDKFLERYKPLKLTRRNRKT